jgi:hypothetical protein
MSVCAGVTLCAGGSGAAAVRLKAAPKAEESQGAAAAHPRAQRMAHGQRPASSRSSFDSHRASPRNLRLPP